MVARPPPPRADDDSAPRVFAEKSAPPPMHRTDELSEQYPIFVLSDRSGLTAETLCGTLLSQFPEMAFRREVLPFLDSRDKLDQAVARIDQVAAASGKRPLVFTTFAREANQRRVAASHGEVFDLFGVFIHRMEAALGQRASHVAGQAHGMADAERYERRISAVNYALRCDDGLRPQDYQLASVILVGVSRCGKTPTSLYLALHFGFHAANYPLTEEDFARDALPESLLAYRAKLFGLTIDPHRLHQIRSERRRGSDYASLDRCYEEVAAAQRMMRRHGILHCDSTAYSVEELGSTIKHQLGLPAAL